MRSRNPRVADRSANHPIVFGAPYSVYVRAVRLALEEKGVPYELVPIDIFAPGGAPPEHQVRHPFGKIPAFEYAGFSLYEAGAITRFVDEVFPGPSLQPDDARARARMNQIISILDSYAYPRWCGTSMSSASPDRRAGHPVTNSELPLRCRKPRSACRRYPS